MQMFKYSVVHWSLVLIKMKFSLVSINRMNQSETFDLTLTGYLRWPQSSRIYRGSTWPKLLSDRSLGSHDWNRRVWTAVKSRRRIRKRKSRNIIHIFSLTFINNLCIIITYYFEPLEIHGPLNPSISNCNNTVKGGTSSTPTDNSCL